MVRAAITVQTWRSGLSDVVVVLLPACVRVRIHVCVSERACVCVCVCGQFGGHRQCVTPRQGQGTQVCHQLLHGVRRVRRMHRLRHRLRAVQG